MDTADIISKLDRNEKILLLQCILMDIRGNWAFEDVDRREVALGLARDLKDVPGMDVLAKAIEHYETGEDGRYFRYDYPRGYNGMENLHGLSANAEDWTKEFLIVYGRVLTYPMDVLEELGGSW